jgi:hypothetical protein
VFFVVGFPRSGTTLVATKLASCPSIYIGPETQFFSSLYYDLRRTKRRDEMIRKYVSHKRISDYGFSEKDFDGLREIDDPVDLLVHSLNGAARSKGKPMVGEKTPAHSLAIGLIKAKIPDAKFIAVVRDCRDAVLSNLSVPFTHGNPYKHAAEWVYYMKRLDEAREQFPDDVFVVRFEDVILDYEEQMSRMLSHLGVDEKEKRSMRDSADAIPGWEEAWKKKAMEKPDSSRVYAWKGKRNVFDGLGISIIAKKKLESLGYDIGVIGEAGKRERLKKTIAVSFYMPGFYIPAKIAWSRLHGRHFY